MLARRRLPLVTRRSGPRPARRHTPHTSTEVCAKSYKGSTRCLLLTEATSPEAGSPRHRYLEPGHVDSQLVCQRHLRARRY